MLDLKPAKRLSAVFRYVWKHGGGNCKSRIEKQHVFQRFCTKTGCFSWFFEKQHVFQRFGWKTCCFSKKNENMLFFNVLKNNHFLFVFHILVEKQVEKRVITLAPRLSFWNQKTRWKGVTVSFPTYFLVWKITSSRKSYERLLSTGFSPKKHNRNMLKNDQKIEKQPFFVEKQPFFVDFFEKQPNS